MIVCDIDGTLTKDDGAVSHCMGSTHSKDDILKMMDPVRVARLEPRIDTISRLHRYREDGHYIILITGRWDYLRSITMAWLEFYQVPFHQMGMRKGSHWQEPAIKVKTEIYEDAVSIGLGKADIWLDDDQAMLDIAESWGIRGIKC